jgi:hypothetical protein
MSSTVPVHTTVTNMAFAVNVFIITVNVEKFQLVFLPKRKKRPIIGLWNSLFSVGHRNFDIISIFKKGWCLVALFFVEVEL